MAYDFINAQIRSILNGLGFKSRDLNEPDFPLSSDDSPLDDQETVQTAIAFQKYFNLAQYGIMGFKTKAVAEQALNYQNIPKNKAVSQHYTLLQFFRE